VGRLQERLQQATTRVQQLEGQLRDEQRRRQDEVDSLQAQLVDRNQQQGQAEVGVAVGAYVNT
jgi:hypothetical protein